MQTISHETTLISEIRKIWHRLPSKFHFYKTNLYFVFKKPGKLSEKAVLFKVEKYGFLKKMGSGKGSGRFVDQSDNIRVGRAKVFFSDLQGTLAGGFRNINGSPE